MTDWIEQRKFFGYKGKFRKVFEELPNEYKRSLGSIAIKNFSLIESLVDRTQRVNREHAVAFCYDRDTWKIRNSSIVTGTESIVEIPKCDPDSELIGVVHTHPTSYMVEHEAPGKSTLDVLNDFELGVAVSCVANRRRVGTEWYTALRCDCYDATHSRYESYREEARELKKELMKVLEEADRLTTTEGEIPEEVVERYNKLVRKVKNMFKKAQSEGVVIKGCFGVRDNDGVFERLDIEGEISYTSWKIERGV